MDPQIPLLRFVKADVRDYVKEDRYKRLKFETEFLGLGKDRTTSTPLNSLLLLQLAIEFE